MKRDLSKPLAPTFGTPTKKVRVKKSGKTITKSVDAEGNKTKTKTRVNRKGETVTKTKIKMADGKTYKHKQGGRNNDKLKVKDADGTRRTHK
jgi:hypothetical protein|tara:strand:- start:694 stop:969 length:276 start_codon:yes stop_codon:yes gene_type:complete